MSEDKNVFKEVFDLIKTSKQPVFYCGGGIMPDGYKSLYRLVKLLHFPITTTMMGLGVFPSNEPENLQMLGMHGSYEANMAMYKCDLMLAIGVRFDDRITGDLKKFSPNSKKVHIDIDKKELNKLVKVDVAVNMNSTEFLDGMLEFVEEELKKDKNVLDKNNTKEWWKQIEKWRSVNCFEYKQKQERNAKILPQFLLDTLNNVAKKYNPFYCTDVGQHQIWATQYCKVNDKRRFITSGGLGTMGFGLPASIGVQVANPNEKVVLITGDGSLIMTMHEMATIKKYKLPVKIVLLNNSRLGMVKQWQEMFYNKNYSETNLEQSNPDFVKLAKSFSIKAKRVKKVKDVKVALEKMMKSKTAYLLEVVVDPDENVYPMIPVGNGHGEIVLRKDF